MTRLLDAALAYAARGWRIIPLYGVHEHACLCTKGQACPTPGKHPPVAAWITAASTDATRIRAWWKRWPMANVGIVTGKASGLIVLDIDPRHQGDLNLDELQQMYARLPETVLMLSGGGGQHYYFAWTDGVPSCDLAHGIQVQAEGRLVVAPPSMHASGQQYHWEVSHEPDETVLAPLPDWVSALARSNHAASATMPMAMLPEILPDIALQALHCSSRIKTLIQTGTDPEQPARYPSRSEALFAAIGAMIHGGHDDATIASVVLNPAYRISDKPRSQRDPRSPFYDQNIKGWVAKEIARARAKSAAAAEAHQRRNGQTPGPEPTDPYACPELPASARVDDERAAEASLWLNEYIAFSQKWAPRAYAGFHEAVGLFVLSTTAARRVKVQLGPRGVFTSLYLGLAGRTSLYTKTTAADIGLGLLRLAGLQTLLADDDATPQAFLRSLTRYVPSDYDSYSQEMKDTLAVRLAFAGQKGWFYEEWGQHLQAMMQKDGSMAAFRSILRRLDDHQDQYTYSTISRGRDVLINPYVTLLANVTPADLRPFVRAQSPLWRDGYIARFCFSAPGQTPPRLDPFPEGEMHYPRPLITGLASWHKRLGIPRVAIEPVRDEKGKPTGRHEATIVTPHRETTYRLSPDVRQAFYAYDDALHTLLGQTKNEDLDGSYVRFPVKALRIAALLASLHDDTTPYTIWPAQWYRGQQIAERWRHDLHALMRQVNEHDDTTRAGKGEQRVIAVLKKHGDLSAIEIHRWTKLAHTDIVQYLAVLQEAGAVRMTDTGRAKKYHYAITTEEDEP